MINSISFHSSGKYLISTSNDNTIKIWDLRRGTILYTLYGHEGPTTASNFSPKGDFFSTGGKDSNLLVWKSNFEYAGEELTGLNTSKITTDVYLTEKN